MRFVYTRSVYARILVRCTATLLFLLVSAFVVSSFLKHRPEPRGVFLAQTTALHLDLATEAYESGGAKNLAGYLGKIRAVFPGQEFFFTDLHGRDLATGEDRSALLARAEPSSPVPHPTGDRAVEVASSGDGRYRLIVITPWQLDQWSFSPYYLLALVALTLLCYSLIHDIASPVRTLMQTLQRFGRGDLSVRMHSKRHDEIGELAHTFDEMADRIQTLLTAERRLLQDISHELRSPLARLSLTAGLLETATDPKPALARLRRNIERLTSMVSTLLQVTRAEGDSASRNFEQIPLRALLEDVLDDCRLEAEARGCTLNLQGSSVPIVVGDRELLRRAIENVLRNAVRYAPQRSSVDVNLDCDHTTVRITVRDHGPGVPEDQLANIFKPFVRVDESRDSETSGVGLGLAIARRAIAIHGGEITAENASPGLLVSIKLSGDGTQV